MFIERIFLQNFKNHQELELKFSRKINFIAGNNGSGKTNLLDAIHYISFTKSAFNVQDALSIKEGADFFALQATISKSSGEQHHILCSQQKGARKSVRVDKQGYERIHEHIGRFPLVMITPFDNDLVREGSETRRKFFDTMISQIDQGYLLLLLQYNHFLKQRNGLLKLHTEQAPDPQLMEIYDQELAKSGRQIFEIRKSFVKEFEPVFQHYYHLMTNGKEATSFHYQSQLDSPMYETKFKAALSKDIILQRTTMGIHKDEYEFSLLGMPIKTHGSQGQQKSYVIALKLANYEIIRRKKGFSPFLLLDDIFEKLDEQRIKRLVDIVSADGFGQIFITDARVESSEKFFANYKQVLTIFNIGNDAVTYV